MTSWIPLTYHAYYFGSEMTSFPDLKPLPPANTQFAFSSWPGKVFIFDFIFFGNFLSKEQYVTFITQLKDKINV